jgi:uncharacterized protein (TIGR03000 family)
MKRNVLLGAALACLAVFMIAGDVHAQRYRRGGYGGGGRIQAPYFYGEFGRGYPNYYYGGGPYYYGGDYSYRRPYRDFNYYDYDVPTREYQSFYPPERAENTAAVRVIVPAADAQVWVENDLTNQRGRERIFISPPLERGRLYHYTLKASWMENGREITREKSLPVRAGEEAVADFTRRENENGKRRATATPPMPPD